MPCSECVRVRDLGLAPYEAVFSAMRAFTRDRTTWTEDEIWCVEHPTVFTLGKNADARHLLLAGSIPVVQSDRGGEVTLHAPGQLVVYPLIDLRRAHLLVRPFVQHLERAIQATLQDFGVTGTLVEDAPGVFVEMPGGVGKFQGLAKIASLGIKVSRGCSYHGLSLNVDMDLSTFRLINPCGYAGLRMTSLARQVPGVRLPEVRDRLVHHLLSELSHA